MEDEVNCPDNQRKHWEKESQLSRPAKKNGGNKNRVFMTGIRKGGDPDFQFTIFGNPASKFPPLILKMSLHEMQQWLREMREDPSQPHGEDRHRLHSIG